MGQLAAALQPADILGHRLGAGVRARDRRAVGRDQDLRVFPEGMLRDQRLVAEDVERGAGHAARADELLTPRATPGTLASSEDSAPVPTQPIADDARDGLVDVSRLPVAAQRQIMYEQLLALDYTEADNGTSESEDLEFRRVRLAAKGDVAPDWKFKVQVEFDTDVTEQFG